MKLKLYSSIAVLGALFFCSNVVIAQQKKIIPVVFHVIHQWGPENVTKASLLPFIKKVNLDFSRSNPDTNIAGGAPGAAVAAFNAFKQVKVKDVTTDTTKLTDNSSIVANCNIEFRLATIDPYGRPTDGIERIPSVYTNNALPPSSSANAFAGYDSLIKSASYWDSKKYLNIWVVDSIGNFPCYAQDPEYREFLPFSDGIVLSYFNLIKQNDTRSLTLELGYWLGLKDLVGGSDYYSHKNCGSDFCDDTPPMKWVLYNGSPFPFKDNSSRNNNRNCISYFDSTKCVKDSVVHFFIDKKHSSVGAKDSLLYSVTMCAAACKNETKTIRNKANTQDSVITVAVCSKTIDLHIMSKRYPGTDSVTLVTPIDTFVLVRSQPNLPVFQRDTINGNMFNNFMAPVNPARGVGATGAYRNMFTKGQRDIIYANLNENNVNAFRNLISTQGNLVATGTDGDSATYANRFSVGGIPHPCYLITDTGLHTPNINTAPYVLDKHFVKVGSAITFTDTSWNGAEAGRVWRFPGGTPGTSTARVVTVQYNTPGNYDVVLKVNNALGEDSMVNKYSIIVSPPTARYRIDYVEDFETTYLGDHGWNGIDYPLNYDDKVSWKLVTGAGYLSNSCVSLTNYDNTSKCKPNRDELVSPPYQILPGDKNGNKQPVMYFYTSYAEVTSGSSDGLKVFYSMDGGSSWTTLTGITSTQLLSGGIVTGPYVPSKPNYWKRDSVSLSSVTPVNGRKDNVLFKFTFNATGGNNNLYIDRIGFTFTALGIEDLMAPNLNLNLYPNPAENKANLTFSLDREVATKVILYDITGRELSVIADEKLDAGEHQYQISNKYGAGIYLLKLKVGEYETVRKLMFN